MSCSNTSKVVGGGCQSCGNNNYMMGGSCSMCSSNMKLFGGKKHIKITKKHRVRRGGSFMDTTKQYINSLDQTLGNVGNNISNSVSNLTNNIKNKLSSQSSSTTQTMGGKRKHKKTHRKRKHKGGAGNSIGTVSQNASSVSGVQTTSPQWVNADGSDVPASWYNSVGGRKRKMKRTKRRRL